MKKQKMNLGASEKVLTLRKNLQKYSTSNDLAGKTDQKTDLNVEDRYSIKQ